MYRNFRKQTDFSKFIDVPGSKNLTRQKVVPAIGDKNWRDRSIHLTDINVDQRSEDSFPKPVESIEIFSKKKSVHFDEFIYVRSLDNDQFIKGRPVDPRRPGFPRQQGSEQDRHDERPRAAERRGRGQADKDVRDGQHTARSINSAPSKDREAPVPKLNSFMKEEKHDKEAANKDRQAIEKAKHQTLLDVKSPDKTVVERDKDEMRDKGRVQRPKENGQLGNERKEKELNLPPDDHGPAFTPTATESLTTRNDQENKENFNYYASVNQTPREKAKPEVPPLQLNIKAPTEKGLSKRAIGSDDMQLMSVTPAKSDKPKSFTGDIDNDTNKKKREVTIIDPKDLRKNADEVEEEAFNKEYEYAHNEERRHKDFEDMDEDEKIEFFKSTYRMKPEQIRELTFHPKTNEPKIIHKTYTGIDAADWEMAPDSARIKSGRRPKSQHKNAYKKVLVIPTYQRKDFMLSRLQGKIYHHISKVYGSSPRDNREKQFYEKLAQIQLDEYRRRYEMLERNERKRLESLFRQREQLKQLRKKFEKDAWRRFMTQYVTSKVVESEFSNRKDYGLPNSLDKDMHARRKRMDDIDLSTKEKMNKKKFEHLFKFNTGPDFKVKGKPLKFEGIDTVYIDTEDESGEHVSQRQDVAQLIKEARLLLSQAEMETPREAKQRVKSDKQPSRQVLDTRNRTERPRHHRSRERRQTESDHTPTRRSKSRTKTPKPPKTIKDVIMKRQSQPINRYRTSEFLKTSSKAKPTRSSNESLHKAANIRKTEPRQPPEKRGQKSVTETSEETIRLLSTSTDGTDKQAQSTKTVMNKTNDYKLDTGKGEDTKVDKKLEHKVEPSKVEIVKEQKQGKRTNTEQKPHTYLEEAETLIGTSRDYDAYSPVKQTVTKTVVSRSHTPVSKTGVPSRPISKASIYTNNAYKPPSITKTNDAVSRRESKASLQVQNETKTLSENSYKQTIPKRAPSVVSIVSKANSTAQKNDNAEIKDTTNVKDKDIVNGGTKIPEKTLTNRSVSRSSVHTVNSIYQNDLRPNKRASKTSVHMNNVVDQVLQKEKDNALNDKSPYNQGSKVNSVQNSTATLKQVPNSKQVSPSPSRVSKVDSKVNGYNEIRVDDDKSHQEPSIKRNVQISETVEVHTKVSDPKTGKHIHQKHVVENGLPDNGSTYNDERMKREDYENRHKVHTQEQPERKRSPRPTQARSKSHERKGPVPKKGKGKQPGSTRATRDRKVIAPAQKQGNSRFPDIDENDRTIANARATPKPQVKRSVKYDEVETETIRTVTPSEKQGAAKWKDLVQKYIRETSPVIGKREDLSVLQTKMDTDDSGSEADIFERAKRRYALDVEDDSDDDDDE